MAVPGQDDDDDDDDVDNKCILGLQVNYKIKSNAKQNIN